MQLPDVNILVYAFRPDSGRHEVAREWLMDTVNSQSSFGFSDIAASGFLRIVTHPGIFRNPDTMRGALGFLDPILERPNRIPIRPGDRHWDIFRRLCLEVSAKGNIVPDAFFAALAMENGCEWVSTDRDYSRFPGLKLKFL